MDEPAWSASQAVVWVQPAPADDPLLKSEGDERVQQAIVVLGQMCTTNQVSLHGRAVLWYKSYTSFCNCAAASVLSFHRLLTILWQISSTLQRDPLVQTVYILLQLRCDFSPILSPTAKQSFLLCDVDVHVILSTMALRFQPYPFANCRTALSALRCPWACYPLYHDSAMYRQSQSICVRQFKASFICDGNQSKCPHTPC